VRNYLSIFLFIVFVAEDIHSDSFIYNSFNNHGVIGLINMPSARFYDEASYGITIYDGTPDQKITMTSYPYDWMEASFFYTNIQGKPYPGYEYQDYKDKGFNFKFRIKEEDHLPSLAIGINDIAGTGLYSSEYIVSSYGVGNIDMHLGIGWGALNGSKSKIKNPLRYIYKGFEERPSDTEDRGGQFQPSRYFSGRNASPFFGVSYALNNRILFKAEYDSTYTDGSINYENPDTSVSFGIDFQINKNLTAGLASERGNYTSLKFIYKNNPNKEQKTYKYSKPNYDAGDTKYSKLIKNFEANGIGVNKIMETSDSIGLELTQFMHPNLDIVEEIIRSATFDAGINKKVQTELRVANLQASSNYDNEFIKNSKLIYNRQSQRSLNTSTKLSFRPFLASREEFFKGSLLLENNSEYIILDNFFFSSNLKYSLVDNFDDLTIPPKNTYPAQVRSDVKDYLRGFDDGVFIGRAQFDFHLSPKKNHHIMATAGILEEMFSGIGFEYLYFKQDSKYAFGFEIFHVKKRDYKMRFGTLDYENVTTSANLYYRNYEIIPFDAKISFGEYLAGDEGFTFEVSRSFLNGTKLGAFATFTDVSVNQFGEGSFDKGIFFNIPVYGNFINYTWKPLTKDPGARLNRKHTLHDLLIKFKPYNY